MEEESSLQHAWLKTSSSCLSDLQPPPAKRCRVDTGCTEPDIALLNESSASIASQDDRTLSMSFDESQSIDCPEASSDLMSLASPGPLNSELDATEQQPPQPRRRPKDVLLEPRTCTDQELARRSVSACFPTDADSTTNRIPGLSALHQVAAMWVLRHTNLPDPNYMSKQRITWSVRSVVVDWMLEISADYRVSMECRALSVRLLDRILSCKLVYVIGCAPYV